jgi:hypothetical protein
MKTLLKLTVFALSIFAMTQSEATLSRSVCADQLNSTAQYLQQVAPFVSNSTKLPDPLSAYCKNAITRLQMLQQQCPY